MMHRPAQFIRRSPCCYVALTPRLTSVAHISEPNHFIFSATRSDKHESIFLQNFMVSQSPQVIVPLGTHQSAPCIYHGSANTRAVRAATSPTSLPCSIPTRKLSLSPPVYNPSTLLLSVTMLNWTDERSYISGENGSFVGGKVAELQDIEHLFPFRKELQFFDGRCRLHLVFDYYGIRYHLLLDRNEQLVCCEENTRLDELAERLTANISPDKATAKCLDLFWPFVAEDSTQRGGKTTEKPTLEHRFHEKSTVNIRLVTGRDGTLSRAVHNEPCLYPLREPIKNPCSVNVPVFQMEDISLLQEMSFNVFKAKLGDKLVCLKVAPKCRMLGEIQILMKVPDHPSIISPLLGLVDAGQGQGSIDKFIIPFIVGSQLSRVRKATLEQKKKWKRQISEAISLLHDSGIAWGDGSIWNVMIDDDESGRAILIDFGEGSCEGSEGFEAKIFEAMKRSDVSALAHLSEYIDNLTTIEKE